MVRLRLLPQALEEAESFVAVCMFSPEDFPFRGLPGKLDGLLESEASRLVRAGKLSGAWPSQAMLASKRRLAPEYVLFAGVGSSEDLTLTALYRRARDVVGRMMRASAKSLSMQISGFARFPDEFAPMATELLSGAIRGAIGHPRDVDILVCEPDEGKYDELVALSERIAFSGAKEWELSLEVVI